MEVRIFLGARPSTPTVERTGLDPVQSEFESLGGYGFQAQMVERCTEDAEVVSSTLTGSTAP